MTETRSLPESITDAPRGTPVVCPSCSAANSAFDQYCGQCGESLSILRWRPEGSDSWREGAGKLAVSEGDPSARLEITLGGVVPRAFVVQDPEPEDGRRWIDDAPLRGEIFQARPDDTVQILEIPLHVEQLEELFEKERRERLDNRNELLARLPLLTNRARLEKGRYTPDRLVLDLVVARQPWVEPSASLYRFVPLERLREPGIDHLITIHDEATADPVELIDDKLEDDGVAGPEGYHRLTPEQVMVVPRKPARSSPGSQPKHLVRLLAPDLELPDDGMGWFSALVIYTLKQGGDQYPVGTRISGVVGRGPALELGDDESAVVSLFSPHRHEERTISVVNPGHLPVRVVGLDVEGPSRGPVPERDWLIVDGLAPGEILAPGEERHLRLRFNRRARPSIELNQEHSYRRIVLRHDGWPTAEEDRQLVIDVQVMFGTFDIHRTLGIDFGTSSSVVCLMGSQRGFPLELEKTGEKRHTLASLLYYDNAATKKRGRDIFLFGSEARNAARNAPTNLVRSIKTIVADNAEAPYLLLKESKGQNIFFETRTAQELLDRFINELVELAEEGVATLGAEERREANIGDVQLSFRHAVFSHPVDVTKSMKEALMRAAHAAFLNEPLRKVDAFFEESCVDEATAAVLAYVYGRLFSGLATDRKLIDHEKVLCFDMGGGTTDLAAVEIDDMAAFDKEERSKVVVRPMAQGGDRRFGGDLVDRRIAVALLKQVQAQSAADGTPIVLEELEHAVESSNFTNYRIGYRERAGREAIRKGQSTSQTLEFEKSEADALYQLALQILAAAELIKRRLSSQHEASTTVRSPDWPWQESAKDRRRRPTTFTFELDRSQLTKIVRKEIESRFDLLGTLVERAGWQWSELTTLLFTGQSIRSPVIRQLVVDYVKERIGGWHDRLSVIEPGEGADEEGRGGFDPKLCVAIGAAIWGLSRDADEQEGRWLDIEKQRLGRQLPFDLTYGGPRYRKISGLEHGAPYPARASLKFSTPRNHLVLYKDRYPYVRFYFEPGRHLDIEVRSPTEIFLTVDGRADVDGRTDLIEGKIQR